MLQLLTVKLYFFVRTRVFFIFWLLLLLLLLSYIFLKARHNTVLKAQCTWACMRGRKGHVGWWDKAKRACLSFMLPRRCMDQGCNQVEFGLVFSLVKMNCRGNLSGGAVIGTGRTCQRTLSHPRLSPVYKTPKGACE